MSYPFEQFGQRVDIDATLAECRVDDRAALVSFDRLRNAAEYQGSVASVAEPLVPHLAALAVDAARQSVRLEARSFLRDLGQATSYAEASGVAVNDEARATEAELAMRVRAAAEKALAELPSEETQSELTIIDFCCRLPTT